MLRMQVRLAGAMACNVNRNDAHLHFPFLSEIGYRIKRFTIPTDASHIFYPTKIITSKQSHLITGTKKFFYLRHFH